MNTLERLFVGLLTLLLLVSPIGAAIIEGGEQLYQYRVSWNGIPAAQATVSFTEAPHAEPPTASVWVELRTNAFVDLFWSLRAQSWAEVDATTLRPVHFAFERRINGRRETTHVEAEGDGLLTGRYARPLRYRLIEVNDAEALDPMAAILRVRQGLPAVGDSRTYEIFTGEARYRIRLYRYAAEMIDVPAGRFSAARIEPEIWREDQGGRDTRVRRVTFWVTDAPPHTLLRVRGEVFIGAVYADLTRWSSRDGSAEHP
jgi:Protein of unknown function (DUF3108)